jgi:4-hydroxymandelate oxidase
MTTPLNLRAYEAHARQLLPQGSFDYYAGGAGDEITLRENEQAWGRIRLRPRVMVDVSACDLRTTVLGAAVSMPVLSAPCAFNMLAHPEGELAVSRAVAAAGMVQVLSTLSSYPLEEVAQAPGRQQWFQLYCLRDPGATQEMVRRVEAAGYLALCLTVDAPRSGTRERDVRNQFVLPPHVGAANFAHLQVPGGAQEASFQKFVQNQFDPVLTWETLDWLRGITRLPIVLKGVCAGEDARIAVEHGVAGICVSNHGGRQLDSEMATCEALPEVVEAVAGKVEVYVDGGIRRGTDVLKALAMGARAVFVGRPYLWGLASDGEAGVRRVFELLREELSLAIALAGCARVGDVGRGLVVGRG